MPDSAKAKMEAKFQTAGHSKREKFHRLCDREMDAYGYTTDATYRTEEAGDRGGARIVVDRDTTDELELELADTPRIRGSSSFSGPRRSRAGLMIPPTRTST